MDLKGIFWKKYDRNILRIRVLWTNFIAAICLSLKGVKYGKKCLFRGIPHIRRYPESLIKIGSHCRFNSMRKSVEMYFTKPCSFITNSSHAKILIGNNVGATSTTIIAYDKVIIGNNVLIGINTTITDNDFHHSDPEKRNTHVPSNPVEIKDKAFIGMNCVILKGVTIGANAVIGANSVVFNSIPDNCIAFGNPCKVIMKRKWNAKKS